MCVQCEKEIIRNGAKNEGTTKVKEGEDVKKEAVKNTLERALSFYSGNSNRVTILR